MGSTCSSKSVTPTLDPTSATLASKPTGTLIYNFAAMGANGMPAEKTTDEFFGLDINFAEVELHDAIGHGSYGKGKHIAVKKIFLSNVPAERAEIMEDFGKEIKILSILKHDCIVVFLGASRVEPNYAIMFELMEGSVGSLMSMVRCKEVKVTWRMCLSIAKDAAEACDYLHSLSPVIIHRDLKAENLLLDGKFNCKLTDFGLSRGYNTKSAMTVCGTPCWVAPEIFRGEPYTEMIDIYSYAIVLWELFCFEKPYQDQDCIELPYLVAKRGLRPPKLSHCPTKVTALMQDCWEERPENRPKFSEILNRLVGLIQEYDSFIGEAVNVKDKTPPAGF